MFGPRVDSHQHFWRYSVEEYGWIDEPMAALRRDFLPEHLRPLLAEHEVDGCVAVQARQTLAETEWLLDLADADPWILGVVGWVDLCAEDVCLQLEQVGERPRLRGVRHIVQAEPDPAFMQRGDFQRGIAALERHGLCYDVLVFPNQLPSAIELCRAFPRQPFVLDHLCKPYVSRHELEPWRGHLVELAAMPNVCCKISGLVTEADWRRWRPEDLRPYLDAALEAFGPERLMFGSDWPVCLVAADYDAWRQVVTEWTASLSVAEQQWLQGGSCARFYGLVQAP